MPQSRRQFLTTLAAAFFGSALIRKITPAEINPSWITAKLLPPSEGIALDWWSQVGDEALRILEGELRCLKLLAVDEGMHRRLGDIVRVREPLRFTPDVWAELDPATMGLDRSHTVLFDSTCNVDLLLNPESLHGLTLPEFSHREIEPAMVLLADNLFLHSRGADLLVTAPLCLPAPQAGMPASVCASSSRLHLRAMTYRNGFSREAEQRVRFEILYGTLRA